ncbi:MAG: 2Fe-2S iron-sulfur cluster-binding protein [Saprospiraceae bacterium]
MQFHSLKISKIVSETEDTNTFYFDIPIALKDQYQFKPGQHLTLKTMINGQEVRRAYSICTAPSDNIIGVTVKKVKNGLMSSFLHSNINEGDTMDVMTPEGHFVLQPDDAKSRDLYFIAAGSGITPVMSMIRSVLEDEPKSIAHLLYGSRDENNIIFKSDLDTLMQKYEGQLVVKYVLSQPVEKKSGGIAGMFSKKVVEWKGPKGRINKEVCKKFFTENEPRNEEKHYFICGPGDFIQNTEALLLDRHIDKKSIHKEYFTPASAPENTSEKQLNTAVVSVTLKGKTFDLEIPKGKTILDMMVDAKKDPPYSCTSGACSTCIAKVIEGEVVMDSCYALDDDEVAAGYILTCQSHPTTTKVVLTYDV